MSSLLHKSLFGGLTANQSPFATHAQAAYGTIGALGEKIRVALEENADGTANDEIEHVFYARLADPSQLENADSREFQEQWEIKVPKTDENAAAGGLRIRKTVTTDGKVEYVLTSKVKVNATKKIEVGVPTTEDQFASFKYLAPGGMIKDRFVFLIEGSDRKWEVDVFHRPEGGYHEWVKIDLEVTDINDPIPPFPIDLRDVIDGRPDKHNEDEEARIRALYSSDFITKNPHL